MGAQHGLVGTAERMRVIRQQKPIAKHSVGSCRRGKRRSGIGSVCPFVQHIACLMAAVGPFACQYAFGDYQIDNDRGVSGSGGGGSDPDVATGGDSQGSGGVASAGTSSSEECPSDTAKCEGQTLTLCIRGQWSSSPTVCEAGLVCNTAARACTVCVKDQKRCQDGELQTCDQELTGWLPGGRCDKGCLDGPPAHCRDCDLVGHATCTNTGNLVTCMADYSTLITGCGDLGCDPGPPGTGGSAGQARCVTE